MRRDSRAQAIVAILFVPLLCQIDRGTLERGELDALEAHADEWRRCGREDRDW